VSLHIYGPHICNDDFKKWEKDIRRMYNTSFSHIPQRVITQGPPRAIFEEKNFNFTVKVEGISSMLEHYQ
jgi:hypothetical protein